MRDDPIATVTVALDGEYDISRTAELRDALFTAADGRTRVVIADLGGVTFMDSTGLRSLLEVRNTLCERGATLRVQNLQPSVARLFSITKVGDLFGISDETTIA